MRELFSRKWDNLTEKKWILNGFLVALAYTVFSRDADVNTITEGQLFLALMISILHSDYATEKLRLDTENQTYQQ